MFVFEYRALLQKGRELLDAYPIRSMSNPIDRVKLYDPVVAVGIRGSSYLCGRDALF